MPDDSDEVMPEDFEEFVAAALKVDPKGLSGKHRKEDQQIPSTKERD